MRDNMTYRKYLKTLTIKQLVRLRSRIWDRIGYGGHFGWDWPTLWAVHPGYAQVLREIESVGSNKEKNGEN